MKPKQHIDYKKRPLHALPFAFLPSCLLIFLSSYLLIFLPSCLLIFLSSCFFSVKAQEYPSAKEKIYIQTDHIFYKPGDVLFYKLYLVNAQHQTPSHISNMAYVELISPAGTLVKKSNLKITDGYADGSFDFAEQAVGGIYKLKGYTNWMKNEKESLFFTKEITLQKVIAPRVLMKLDFPEKGYGAGSEVVANFSMRNLNNEPIRNYQGNYTISVGGDRISNASFKTNDEGKAVIHFTLPNKLTTNDGLLNVMVDYDSYTEAISRSIPIVLNKIDLQFMPEGGNLVEGITSNLAFKALNENGKAADIKGEILDNAGNKITSFESYHFGMGKCLFTPQAGKKYKAIITSPANITQQFALPNATMHGVVMHIEKIKKIINITLTSSIDIETKLVASAKNIVFNTQNMSLHKGENKLKLEENDFPAGIAQFTLYASNNLPLAERLVFLNENKQLQVTITPDKQQHLPREKVNLTIKTLDENGKPVPSNFSLSVVDDKLWTFADDKQDHILSWLLMSSELKGKVEEPQFYFKKDEPKAIPALDLVMLTNGYRYFDYIQDIVKTDTLKYTPDQDNVLSGQVLNDKNQPVRAKMFLVNTVTEGKALQIITNKDGQFFFSGLLPKTNYYLFAQSFNKKETVTIHVLQNGIGYNSTATAASRQIFDKANNFALFNPIAPVQFKKEKVAEFNILPGFKGKANALNEVVVIGYGKQRKKDLTGSVVSVNGKDVIANNIGQALQGRVAGLDIARNGNPGAEFKVKIRGIGNNNNQPLFVVNGVSVSQFDIANLNVQDIESITVLKDAAATSLYGAQAANGVIIIQSKKLNYSKYQLQFGNKYVYASQYVYTGGQNYDIARKFYVPKYTTITTNERTDFRETIYWNPVIQTDKNGLATVEFYNSDATTTFRAIAEGIGYNGKLGRAEKTYSVQSALHVDAKIPPYLTVGDKALIPLTIKNNSLVDLPLTISVVVPTNFKVGDYNNNITVQPNSSLQVLVPVEATATAKGNLQLNVSGNLVKENISLPIEATAKGFPVITTISGNQSAQNNFNISKMIPSTLTAKLKLYKTMEGQLLDGIESILREPYGCFEQTSSTTYPNIYVLKYLREAGKSNPESEKKAMDYLERGYKRLIGFETADNGFEWFGHTPPHEALTAYGLLEFTDMQQFIEVDQKMLERTKQFLLKRRDGNGSFSLINRGLDAFASVPGKIANIYIVYALTQAGVGKEIQKEYETQVKKALESKDGYQLAMMAIAASNMKDAASYNILMDELEKQSPKPSLNAETSVVNSRDASLRVETEALYAMALMKNTNPQLGKVANLIAKILSEKNYYGYGSTQATVMALGAIVNYSKLIGKISEDAPVSFAINNTPTVGDSTLTSNLHDGNNIFTVNYLQKDKAIPYNLEVGYSTFTPPNSEKADLHINATLKANEVKVGETVRMDIAVTNTKNILQPMAIAKIGIPAGLAMQPWQLKEFMEKNQVAYYEIFDNYLVFYWMGFAPNETKTIHLDLKAEIPGTYKGKASNTYLYYTPEYKNWNDGVEVSIK